MIEEATTNAGAAATSEPVSPPRDWFLCNSAWLDTCWVFAPTSALEEERPVRIRWDFMLPSGEQFTSRTYVELLNTSRRLIALIRTR